MIDIPEDVEFFNVEGIPVTIGVIKGRPYCARWDKKEPDWYDPETARRNGKPLFKDEFLAFVEECLEKPHAKHDTPTIGKPNLWLCISQWLGSSSRK